MGNLGMGSEYYNDISYTEDRLEYILDELMIVLDHNLEDDVVRRWVTIKSSDVHYLKEFKMSPDLLKCVFYDAVCVADDYGDFVDTRSVREIYYNDTLAYESLVYNGGYRVEKVYAAINDDENLKRSLYRVLSYYLTQWEDQVADYWNN